MEQPCVYILASKNNNVIYVGVTTRLQQRVWQHKNGIGDGFTKRYHVHKLIYFEVHEFIESAILREKQIKRWKREWKNNLVNNLNPNWDDLYDQL